MSAPLGPGGYSELTMAESSNPPPPVDYAGPRRHDRFRRASRMFSGVVVAWFVIFLAIFFAGASAFEDKPRWWTIPAIGGTAAVCAEWAWLVRRRNPAFSAGLWIGVALGLLHAGLCFSGM